MDIAADAARRFLVTRQLLAPARSVEGGPEAVLEVFRRLGSIQFDPLSVAGRTYDLVLHAGRRLRPRLVRRALRAPRALRGVQQGALARPLRRHWPGEAGPGATDHPGRTALREELVEEGELVPVTVEGMRGRRFVLREEVELLNAPPEPPLSVVVLPPFDAAVWDRGLLRSLFGFDYVWELFIPPAERRWGWYVLPILFGDRLVGGIEPRIERMKGSVRVLNLW